MFHRALNILFSLIKSQSCHNIETSELICSIMIATSAFNELMYISVDGLDERVSAQCPNAELFLVRVFLYSYWIQKNTDQK